MNYDLVVAYRVYPGIAKIPPVYANDKLKLVELCFKSFVLSLADLKVKIYVLLDGCPMSMRMFF